MLIGITGRKNRGKDTIADYLVEEYGFTKLSFAGPLKLGCKEIFGLTDDQLYDEKMKEEPDDLWGITPRKMLQFMGTEVVRELATNLMPDIGNDFWITRMKKSLRDESYTVISDVRFQNEIDFIKQEGGFVIKVHRNVPDNEFSDHPSELGIDHLRGDFDLVNEGTVADLHKKIDALVKALVIEGL